MFYYFLYKMSLYNMINWVNPLTFFLVPVLGFHPEEIPRYRDCFMNDEDRPEYKWKIHIYTRVWWNNRESYDMSILTEHEEYVYSYDDPFDSTYWTYVSNIPKKFEGDVNKVLRGEMRETSKEYQELIINTFPKIREKITKVFEQST